MSSTKREAADRIHSAAIHLLRRVREVDAKAMGISPARASALSVLVFGGARSLTELAAAEQVTSATMSKLVTAMEGEGLVRRYPDVNDARSIRIEPTAKGRRILERGRKRRLDLLEQLLGGASDAEIAAVGTAASVVERAVESA
ncbi:MAG: MarR family transcriptional regulator [Actinobacteria bacterium]|nr:MAG: MarR family transcriptional regulator [Actinomycetota bacterium]